MLYISAPVGARPPSPTHDAIPQPVSVTGASDSRSYFGSSSAVVPIGESFVVLFADNRGDGRSTEWAFAGADAQRTRLDGDRWRSKVSSASLAL